MTLSWLWLLTACDSRVTIPVDEPGPLEIGVATVMMPVPLGIPTVGYGLSSASAGESPYADFYPATWRLRGHPEFKAAVVSRGEDHEVVFLRGDFVGIFQQFRSAVVDDLELRLGRDLDDALVMGATHTHSGPGRVVQGGGLYTMIADKFFPEHYARVVDAAADAVELAYADLRPGRLAWTTAQAASGHSDRRCEDGRDYTNDTVSLLALEQDGQLSAVVMAYAVHSTILSRDDLTLSTDAAGGIEAWVEDGFDHPVEALFFDSWGGDMSPGSPTAPGVGAPQRGGFERMEVVGHAVAQDVHAALDVATLAWEAEPVVGARTTRVAINREVLGYESGEFPYEYGGMYCTGTVEDCDVSTITDDLDQYCLGFTEDFPAPGQTMFTAGQLGSTHFITFPGEAVTTLAEVILAEASALDGVESVAFFGYTQDFTGYSVLIDDYWQGGYEAGAGLWGPLQGEYYVDKAVESFDRYLNPAPSPVLDHAGEPAPLPAFEAGVFAEYLPNTGEEVGVVAAEVHAQYAPLDVVEFAVYGEDPWLGTPVAYLETAAGEPVLRANGVPVDSRDFHFWTELEVSPTWGEDSAAESRHYRWRIFMPASHAVPSAVGPGSYRLRVALPVAAGFQEVVSAAFEITAP